MSLSEERLAEMREQADYRAHYSTTARDVLVLLDEVERLRAGIEALISECDDPKDDLRTPDYYGALAGASCDLDDLLNPTEGDDR